MISSFVKKDARIRANRKKLRVATNAMRSLVVLLNYCMTPSIRTELDIEKNIKRLKCEGKSLYILILYIF